MVFLLAEPKSDRSWRAVNLAPGVLAALKDHRLRQLEERLAAGPAWEDWGLIFCREDGRPWSPSIVEKAFHRALEQAGLPRLRLHDLRHTAATLLLADGTHPKYVQELLGHSTIKLTLDTYSQVTPAIHQEVAVKMQLLFVSPAIPLSEEG